MRSDLLEPWVIVAKVYSFLVADEPESVLNHCVIPLAANTIFRRKNGNWSHSVHSRGRGMTPWRLQDGWRAIFPQAVTGLCPSGNCTRWNIALVLQQGHNLCLFLTLILTSDKSFSDPKISPWGWPDENTSSTYIEESSWAKTSGQVHLATQSWKKEAPR